MTTIIRLRRQLFAGGAMLALVAATPALASPADDARDARIAKLEAAVAALQGQVTEDQRLHAQNSELKTEVQDLQTRVADLKTTTIAQIDTVRTSEQAQPQITFRNGRPTFSTPDGQFTASLRGDVQLDTAAYFQPSAGPTSTDFRRDGPALGASSSNIDAAHARDLKDGTDWRRARIGIDGTAYGDWDYRLLFDFGGSGVENAGQLYEAWVQYSGLKPLYFRAGAFPAPVGLEDQASNYTMLFLERPGISDIVRNTFAGDARVAAGGYAYGPDWFVSGDVTGRTIGVVNSGTLVTSTPGAIATAQSYGDQLAFVGRVNVTPLHGSDWRINVGGHAGYVDRPPNASGPGTNGVTPVSGYAIKLADTPELRVDGTQFINTGNIPANNASDVGGEFTAQWRSLYLQGEYDSLHISRSDGVQSPSFSGWYVEGSWLLTGESRLYTPATAAFDGPAVAHPFSLKNGGLGAWELAARYSDTDLNFDAGAPGAAPKSAAIRGGDQQVWSLGLNWYPNQVIRFMFDVDEVHIDRLSPNAAVYGTPTGAQIGQTFTAVAVRTQAAF